MYGRRKRYGYRGKRRRFNRRRGFLKRRGGTTRAKIANPYKIERYIPSPRLGGHIFPDYYQTKLRYQAIFGFDSASSSQTFRGNSVFDPDYALGGAQPEGFDQIMNFYDMFRVASSSITCRIVPIVGDPNATTGEETQYLAAVYPSQSNSVKTLDHVLGQPYCTYKAFNGYKTAVIYNKMSTRKIYGMGASNDATFNGSSGGNPTWQWYWCFRLASLSGVTSVKANVVFTLTYDVAFFQRKQVADDA